MKAIWNDTIIAESDDIVEVEGRAYFPLSSLRLKHMQASDSNSVCPWKGAASYFSLRVGDAVNTDAAWYYPSPLPGAEQVADRVAFWRGVQVVA